MTSYGNMPSYDNEWEDIAVYEGGNNYQLKYKYSKKKKNNKNKRKIENTDYISQY